jgi:hypothetical protein
MLQIVALSQAVGVEWEQHCGDSGVTLRWQASNTAVVLAPPRTLSDLNNEEP